MIRCPQGGEVMDGLDNMKRPMTEDEVLGMLRDFEIAEERPYRPMYNINYMQPVVCEHGETPWNCWACADWRRM